MRISLPIALVVTFAFVACNKKDDKVDAKEVPPAVVKTVTDRHPKASITGWTRSADDKGAMKYEADVVLLDGKNKHEFDVVVAADGKLLKEEEKLEFKDLPKNIRDAFESSTFSKWKISKVEKSVKNGDDATLVYELRLKDGTLGTKKKISIDPTGKVTEDSDDEKK